MEHTPVLNDGFCGKTNSHPKNLMLVQPSVQSYACMKVGSLERNKNGWATFKMGGVFFYPSTRSFFKNSDKIFLGLTADKKVIFSVQYSVKVIVPLICQQMAVKDHKLLNLPTEIPKCFNSV